MHNVIECNRKYSDMLEEKDRERYEYEAIIADLRNQLRVVEAERDHWLTELNIQESAGQFLRDALERERSKLRHIRATAALD